MAENRIAFFRRESGMNQKELGQQLGVAQTTVSAWERGINEPDNESMHKMAKMFHTTIGYLAGYEADSPNRGLTGKDLDLWQQKILVQKERESQIELMREYYADEQEEKEFAEEALQTQRYEDWQAGTIPQTFEGYLASTIVDEQEPERRKWLVETLEQLIKAPK